MCHPSTGCSFSSLSCFFLSSSCSDFEFPFPFVFHPWLVFFLFLCSGFESPCRSVFHRWPVFFLSSCSGFESPCLIRVSSVAPVAVGRIHRSSSSRLDGGWIAAKARAFSKRARRGRVESLAQALHSLGVRILDLQRLSRSADGLS